MCQLQAATVLFCLHAAYEAVLVIGVAVFVVVFVPLDLPLRDYMVVDSFRHVGNVHGPDPHDHDPDLVCDRDHGPNRDLDPNHDRDCHDCNRVIDDLCHDCANAGRFCPYRDHGRRDGPSPSEYDHVLNYHFSEKKINFKI